VHRAERRQCHRRKKCMPRVLRKRIKNSCSGRRGY